MTENNDKNAKMIDSEKLPRMVHSIDELSSVFNEFGISSRKTRFIVGVDSAEVKYFGIFYNPKTSKYIVYKNKDVWKCCVDGGYLFSAR